ncbi:ester cyclase [Zhouia spongiae]|uniref:Ester cyclase n=1 Tax=Zhouia spongiae TaxID=2202721 RepID=A0ABY3YM42_9FLAO|nr:ester cyclase [Zhouia spongiae]UNY98768.1 ester cyclase [Zhouia spongiae]
MESKIKIQNQNKELIKHLYNVVINGRKWDELPNMISKKYTNEKGHKGVRAFKKDISDVINIFPDALWAIEKLISEDNNVVVRQTIKKTHKKIPGNNSISHDTMYSQGYVIYTLENGKIFDSEILMNAPAFSQQPAHIPKPLDEPSSNVYFVDRFIVPIEAYSEFMKKMSLSRNIIKKLPGFIKDEVMINDENDNTVKVITIALWKNLEHFENAKERAFEEYKKVNFDPKTFTQRLGIQRVREVYKSYEE